MRGLLKFLFTAVIILAIAWLAAWWYAEGRMQTGITNWADKLATQGWKVSYSNLSRGTSPLTASLAITDLLLSPPPDAQGETGTITLPTVGLRIDLLNPLTLHTDLPNRIAVDIGNNFDAAVTFSAISLTEQLDPHVLMNNGDYPYRSGDFSANGVDILASQGSLLVLHMDGITSHFSANPSAGPNNPAVTLDQSFNGVAVSPLMTHLLGIPFDGRITHLALGVTLSGPLPAGLADLAAQLKSIPVGDTAAQQKLIVPAVHEWAAAGGNGNVTLSGILGPTAIDGAATVKFDANLQPAGTADLTADHLDQFFAALTNAYPSLQNDVAQAEAQLSPYLTTSDQGGQALAVHVIYGSGAVTVNGQKMAPLPPVNWTTLENPPPAPAPGDGAPNQ